MNNRSIVIRDTCSAYLAERSSGDNTTRAGLPQNTRAIADSLSPPASRELISATRFDVFLTTAGCDRDLGHTGWTGSSLQRDSFVVIPLATAKRIDVYNELFYLHFDNENDIFNFYIFIFVYLYLYIYVCIYLYTVIFVMNSVYFI